MKGMAWKRLREKAAKDPSFGEGEKSSVLFEIDEAQRICKELGALGGKIKRSKKPDLPVFTGEFIKILGALNQRRFFIPILGNGKIQSGIDECITTVVSEFIRENGETLGIKSWGVQSTAAGMNIVVNFGPKQQRLN